MCRSEERHLAGQEIFMEVIMKKFAGALILLIVGALLSCPKPTGSTSPSKVWVVSTLAGSGNRDHADGPATAARFALPAGVAVDAAGNVYVADTHNHRIRKIALAEGESDRVVSTIAGGSTSGSADGAGTSARFYYPTDVALDSSGNLYVADQYNHRIRKITLTNGQVDTIAGSGTTGFEKGGHREGFAKAVARFNYPTGLALDAAGNIYVADNGNNRIRKIALAEGEQDRVVSTIAGSTQGSDDGAGTAAKFWSPTGVAVDSSGNIYVADSNNERIRKITSEGVSTLAGGLRGSDDGVGAAAKFFVPHGVAVDAEGNVYVGDSSNNLIRKITAAGRVSTIAGGGSTASGDTDGPGRSARFTSPYGVALDAEGNLYVADRSNSLIRKMEYKLP